MALDGTSERRGSPSAKVQYVLFQVVGVVVLVGEEDRWTRRQGWLSNTDQTWTMVIISVCQFVFIDRRLRHPLLFHAFPRPISRPQVRGAWIPARHKTGQQQRLQGDEQHAFVLPIFVSRTVVSRRTPAS